MSVGAYASGYGARPRSVGNGGLTRKERVELKVLTTSLAKGRHYARRPKVLADCIDEPGPCPWVGCRYNLFLDVDEANGAVKLNFPGREIDELEETCALRVAARSAVEGGMSLERVGELGNITLERVPQLDADGLRSLRRKIEASDDYPPAFREMIARLVAGMETTQVASPNAARNFG
jgi:hypothetical protein